MMAGMALVAAERTASSEWLHAADSSFRSVSASGRPASGPSHAAARATRRAVRHTPQSAPACRAQKMLTAFRVESKSPSATKPKISLFAHISDTVIRIRRFDFI